MSLENPEIVVLDGHTLNPGDLSWDALQRIGNCKVYDRSPAESVVERIGDAAIVLTNKVVIGREVMDGCPKLKYIGVLATGYNVVDIEEAKMRRIVVTNAPGYSTPAVAQMVFAHILHFTQNVCGHDASVKKGDWSKNPDFCYWISPLSDLEGKTLGLIGFGQIAKTVARIALAFGMRVLCFKPNPPDPMPQDVSFVDRETLFQQCDFISLHCPLNEMTRHMINERTLSLMKPECILINTGRGDLIDETALAKALEQRRIAGVGLDVSCREPIAADHPFLTLENCVITPHIAWATRESRQKLLQIVVKNLESFLAGSAVNVVNS